MQLQQLTRARLEERYSCSALQQLTAIRPISRELELRRQSQLRHTATQAMMTEATRQPFVSAAAKFSVVAPMNSVQSINRGCGSGPPYSVSAPVYLRINGITGRGPAVDQRGSENSSVCTLITLEPRARPFRGWRPGTASTGARGWRRRGSPRTPSWSELAELLGKGTVSGHCFPTLGGAAARACGRVPMTTAVMKYEESCARAAGEGAHFSSLRQVIFSSTHHIHF